MSRKIGINLLDGFQETRLADDDGRPHHDSSTGTVNRSYNMLRVISSVGKDRYIYV